MFTNVYLSTRGFIALTPAFNFPVRPFNLATCAFCFLTRAFELGAHRYEHKTQLVARLLLFQLLRILSRELKNVDVSHGSEHASGSEYVRVLSIPGF